MGLLSELRRRNVVRMATLYIVAAWLIVQVAGELIDLAHLPDWVGPSILVLVGLGFPIALVLSWFYELTPEGIAQQEDVEAAGPDAPIRGRRLDFLIISLLCAAVLLLAYDKWWTSVPVDQSIAVLPFESLSPGDDNASVLALGIQDELLTRLSKLDDFKVISRTSVERYRDTQKSIPDIAAELGVSTIMEGRVQQVADKIRINVQLIDAATDKHIWAETYDRQLTSDNVLAIQSEVVGAIVRQLDVDLTSTESQNLAAMPTDNLDAYTAYLTAKTKSDVESIESLNAAVDSFRTAVELDPDFALAYVGLADAYLTLSANFLGGLARDESTAKAEPPLVRALALDPALPEAHATLGLLREEQGNELAAEQEYEEAISLNSNYPRAWRLYGRLRWHQGRLDEAMDLMQTALRLNPYSVPVNYDIARLYDESGRFEEALGGYLRVIEIEPNHAFAYVYIAAIHYLVFGRVDESLVWYKKAADHDALSPSLQAAQAVGYLELGDPDSAKEWIERGLALKPDTFWTRWTSLLYSVYMGDEAASQANAHALLEVSPRHWGAHHVLRNLDLAAGRYTVARSRYARAFRELMEPEVPEVDNDNYKAAIDLALVLLRLDEDERASDLLEASEKIIATMPRLGVNGYDICDVRIYALQQRRERALEALQQAIDEGWRLWSWFYLDHDPNLESIRHEPEFQRLYARVREDLESQARRVQELRSSGEL